MLIKDADSGVSNWVSIARSLMTLYRIHTTDNPTIVKSKVPSHFRSKIMENLKEQIILNKKLCTYASFKTVYKFEHYLDLIPSKKKRSNFAKLRLSAHNLRIETGRYGKNPIPRIDRKCPYCQSFNKTAVEDEIHFLSVCPLYETARNSMLSLINSKFPRISSLDLCDTFIWLMSQEDADCLISIANFISLAFESRESFG